MEAMNFFVDCGCDCSGNKNLPRPLGLPSLDAEHESVHSLDEEQLPLCEARPRDTSESAWALGYAPSWRKISIRVKGGELVTETETTLAFLKQNIRRFFPFFF